MITNEYGVETRQRELLAMLKDIDYFLSKNNITYSLCGGSLLGAIRHGGFIPWDDDIDIMLDRNNYNHLLNILKKNNGQISSEKFENSAYFLTRIYWIYRIQKLEDIKKGMSAATVDIFVMDHCPNNVFVRKLKVIIIKILQGMMKNKLDLKKQTLGYKICLVGTYILGKMFSDETKFKLYEQASQIGNSRKTNYVTGYNDLFKLLNLCYTGNLMEEVERHQFEDLQIPITREYDNYLSTQYGDYMTPPPKEERVAIHV